MDIYATELGFRTTALRYANVYGPRQSAHGEAGVVAIFCDQLLRGRCPRIFGDGAQTRDFVFVGDVVSANLAVLEGDANGVFHVGTAIETSIGALCAMIQRFTRTNATPIFEPARAGEQRRSSLDARRLTAQTGWRAATSLADGLAATVAFFAPHIAATERSRVTQRFCRTG